MEVYADSVAIEKHSELLMTTAVVGNVVDRLTLCNNQVVFCH